MTILVDADACPVKAIVVRLARERGIPVVLVGDTSHRLDDGYSRVVTVDRGRDSADIKLIGLAARGDLVITQDYGVAAMALGKGADALRQDGLRYSDQNLDQLLWERHLGAKLRRGGGHLKGPKKRTAEDDARFENALRQILDTGKEGQA